MPIDDQTPQSWFNAILGLLLAVISFIVNMYRQKIDRLELSHRNFVTREELERHVAQIRDDKLQMHRENLTRMDRIDDAINRVQDRVDRR